MNSKNILLSYIQVCDTHADRLQTALLNTSQFLPFTMENLQGLNFQDAALVEVVTSRFAKLQDAMGQKIFPLLAFS